MTDNANGLQSCYYKSVNKKGLKEQGCLPVIELFHYPLEVGIASDIRRMPESHNNSDHYKKDRWNKE